MKKLTIDKNKLFVFISTYCWWLLRHFISKSPRCKKCLVSKKFTNLHKGICQLCVEFNQETPSNKFTEAEVITKNTSQVQEVMQSLSEAETYHALLMLSGGKDSAYILKRIKEEYPHLLKF